ncbi:MAG: permease-like cell division protein FtsX [Bacteroidota bacterium]
MAEKAPKVRRKKTTLGSYPFAAVVFSISVALFIIGLFGLIVMHATRLSEVIKEHIEIQIYLQRNIAAEDQVKIGQMLAITNYADAKPGSPGITFVSRDVAAKKFIEETGEDFITFLGENPLRDAYVLHVKPELSDAAHMQEIKAKLEQFPGVFEVEYVESLVNEVNNNISKIGMILICFAAVLLFTVVILIHNAIRMALFSQRFLIRSMQLVGAEPWFIISPFVSRAAWQGLLSGTIASLLLTMLIQYANSAIPELKFLQSAELIVMLLMCIIVAGCLISFLSAWWAVSRYLKLSLDELH